MATRSGGGMLPCQGQKTQIRFGNKAAEPFECLVMLERIFPDAGFFDLPSDTG